MRAGEQATDGPAAQARLMLQAFGSVGVTGFAITLTDAEGAKIASGGFRSFCGLPELRATVPALLDETTAQQRNLIVRPHRVELVDLIQLDDLDAAGVERVAGVAFLSLQTSPGNFQVWVAVTGAPPDFARRFRKGVGADPTASGAARIAGSRNFKTKYAPDYPCVQIDRVHPGCITTAATLELAGLIAAPEVATTPPARVSRRVSSADGAKPAARRARKWPDYQRCLEGAPIGTSGNPKRSHADFTWCMIAIDWGWPLELTAERLLEVSTKAKENGEAYARMTAANAAEAVARRRAGPPPKSPATPRQ